MSFKMVSESMQGITSDSDPFFQESNKGSHHGSKVLEAVAVAERNVNRTLEAVSKETGILSDKISAKYKIEVLFGPNRTMKGPNPVRIMCWESGNKFHGGGDSSMFFCKDGTKEDGEGCWTPIPSEQVKGGVAFCAVCNKGIFADKLTIMKEGRVSTTNLSGELVKIFRQLGSSADIYCKYNKDDIHYIAMKRARGEEAANRLLGLHIYPLKNILRDTSGGADLSKRFFAFLTS